MFNIQKTILKMIMAKWLKSDYVIIDTETTGLRYDYEIIEISIINMRGDVLLNTLVRPTGPIPPEVTKINNITDEMVAAAPTWPEVFPLVENIITGRKWLAWNSSFDARMMVQSCLKTGVWCGLTADVIASIIRTIETRHIDAKATYGQWYGEFDKKHHGFKRQSLATAAARHNVSTVGAHRALADCMMVLGVLDKVCHDPHLPPVFSPVDLNSNSDQELAPCPFCSGPPARFVHHLHELQWKPLFHPADYGDEGLYAGAYVFCHECGAQGEEIDGWVYEEKGVRQLEAAAKEAWNSRNARHISLYNGEALQKQPIAWEARFSRVIFNDWCRRKNIHPSHMQALWTGWEGLRQLLLGKTK